MPTIDVPEQGIEFPATPEDTVGLSQEYVERAEDESYSLEDRTEAAETVLTVLGDDLGANLTGELYWADAEPDHSGNLEGSWHIQIKGGTERTEVYTVSDTGSHESGVYDNQFTYKVKYDEFGDSWAEEGEQTHSFSAEDARENDLIDGFTLMGLYGKPERWSTSGNRENIRFQEQLQ